MIFTIYKDERGDQYIVPAEIRKTATQPCEDRTTQNDERIEQCSEKNAPIEKEEGIEQWLASLPATGQKIQECLTALNDLVDMIERIDRRLEQSRLRRLQGSPQIH